jgi:GH24 family phage-related lysozyme (muramidase)
MVGGKGFNMNIKKIIREEMDDLSWISDIEPTLDACDATNILNVGDRFIIPQLMHWSRDPDTYLYNVEATVIAKDKCSTIQPTNTCNQNTILFHVENEDYGGFTLDWYKSFKDPKHIESCSDGNCMYIICEPDYEKDYDYYPQGFRLINNINESDDPLKWVKDVTDKINVGTCLLSDNGVEYVVQDISYDLENVYVKSKRGGARQTWSLRSLNIALENGKLKMCDINESDDFDWARGDVYFTIDEIMGKRMLYRVNNLSDLEDEGYPLNYIQRGQVSLGDIRYHKGWRAVRRKLNEVILDVEDGGSINWSIKQVEKFVNLGIWVLLDDNGRILNDFSNKNLNESNDFDWVNEINPMDIIVNSIMNSVWVIKHRPYAYFKPWNYNIPYHIIKDKGSGEFKDSYDRFRKRFFKYLDEGVIQLIPLEVIKYIRKGLSYEDKFYIWDSFIDNILTNMGFKRMNESDDFDWIRDSDPVEVINLKDEWHVSTIKVGDRLEITGEEDGVEFYNEPCEVICVNTCSKSYGGTAWRNQILVSFEREFYSEENDENTHCGQNHTIFKKCNCREVEGVVGHDCEPHMVGTCWWIWVPYMEEVVRLNVGGLDESEKILESLFNRLSILTEDGKTEPDMEWDFTKTELDKSKRWVKTKEDVKKYLTLLFDKMRRIPKKVKLNIIKYVLASFIGILTFTELQQVVDEVSPEKIELNFTKKEKPKVVKTPEVIKNVKIRKPSSRLFKFLRDEEGLETTAYDIGDGMITVGYGHAERKGKTDMVAGKTKISKEKAEELLKQDVGIQTRYLNRILKQWEEKGINPEITQGMYDAMISLMYNMGYGNFREADFVQDIKRGDFESAKEKIKKTHITMKGHKPRREKESELFSS